jgi:hypothetical protein
LAVAGLGAAACGSDERSSLLSYFGAVCPPTVAGSFDVTRE